MTIRLEYAAMIRLNAPPSGQNLELPEGCTAGGLLDRVGVSKVHQRSMTVYANNERVLLTHILKPDDHVFLALPISGG